MSLRASLWQDDLSQLEIKQLLFVSPDHSVEQVVATMRSAGEGCILICENEKLIGIFTERDLIKRVLANGAAMSDPVRDHMTSDPVTVFRDDSVGWAIRTMHKGHYRHLPVIDRTGHPIGILSVKAIVHYLVEHFPSVVYNLPPDPGQVNETREGA